MEFKSVAAIACAALSVAAVKAEQRAAMREYVGVSGVVSEWISAVDAPVADGARRKSQLSADGTSLFKYEFTNPAQVRKATWFVSGLGVFEAYVNGARVGGDDALKPGFTHAKKTKYFFSYDVTAQLKTEPGARNVLSAEVSSGWWRDKIVHYAGRKSAFRGELELEFADGTSKVVGTRAGEWLAGVGGRVKRASIFGGEIYDARVAADSAEYKPAEANTEFEGLLLPSVGAEVVRRFDLALKPVEAYCWKGVEGAAKDVFGTVVKTRTFKKGDTLSVGPGETLVVDFGQNAAAVPHFRMTAKAGTTLTCLPAEMLNEANGERRRGNDGPAGSVYRLNLRMPGRGMRLEYTFGDEPADYFPRFTFFGYRYISVTATGDVALTVESVPVTSIKKEMETGRIETGVADVNKLISNIYWGQLSNYLSVPTDCPQRNERLGWTADTQVFAEAASYNANVYGFLRKWMRDVRDTQHDDGSYTGVAPQAQYGSERGHQLGWADAGIIVPYTMWKQFGDTRVVEESWESMTRYMKLLEEMKYTSPQAKGHQWADWLSYEKLETSSGKAYDRGPDGKRRPKADAITYWQYLGCSYWLWDARMMATMADAIGKKGDADAYRAMADRALAFLRGKFLDAKDGMLLPLFRDMQTPALFALKLGILERPDAIAKTKAALLKNFKDHGDCLRTGFLGTSILMDTLTYDVGAPDMAYTLLLQHKNPSWLYSVDQGATTIWERWNSYVKATGFGPVGMNSFNHYAYGAVLAWIYKTAAGIAADPKSPGFKNIVMAPKPDRRIGYVKAEYKTPHGLVKSAWRYNGSAWIWTFTVPDDATASVTVPGETETTTYRPGTYTIERRLP